MSRTGAVPWPGELARVYQTDDVWRGQPLGVLYHRWADQYGRRTALVDGAWRISYRELAEQADALAAGLLRLGLRGGSAETGDNIVVQLPNQAEFVVLLLACARVGIAPVLMLPAHREHELVAAAQHVGATAVVVSGPRRGYDFEALGRRVRAQVPTVRHVLVSEPPSHPDSTALAELSRPGGRPAGVRPDPLDTVLFLLSGGTTGLPKLISRTHNDYEYNFRRSGEVCGVTEDTVYLAALPAGHNFPLGCPGILGTLAAGGRVVLAPSPNPEQVFDAIRRERVTMVAAVPAVLRRWAHHAVELRAQGAPADLSSLRLVQVGGSVLTPEAYQFAETALGTHLQQVFGMAEGLLNFTRFDDGAWTRRTTQGRPMSPYDEIRLVDERDLPVPMGAEGELLVRGPYTPRGYYAAPEHNRRAYTPDGWYRTGDLVRLAPSGNLVVTGRSKDIVNRGGEKIAADEVEQLALALPEIDEAAVVSYPDAELGERICLYAMLAPGADLDLARLRAAFAARGTAAYKIPERLEIVPELPYTPIGKIDKKALRRWAVDAVNATVDTTVDASAGGHSPVTRPTTANDSGVIMPHNLLLSPVEPDTDGPPRYSWTVKAERPVEYEVRVARGVLDKDNPSLLLAGAAADTRVRRRFLVVDATVAGIYGDQLAEYLEYNQVDHRICVLDAVEEHKTMDAVFEVVAGLDEFGIDRRREPIIGIGGGVLLDIVGLASSLYRRHTPYIRVPTTLIGLVDAGVGAKNGVNFGRHKNRLGSYEPPAVSLLDRSFLATLDERHIANGLAEILKIALIKDRELFDELDTHAETLLAQRLQGTTEVGEAAARTVLRHAVHGMLEELQPNLWEHRLERLVDYGHTFSPTIEMRALPDLLHGEAVNIDMALTTMIGVRRGLVSESDRDRVLSVMRRLRLPVWHPECVPSVLERALTETTRHRDGLQRLPLPVGIGGAAFVNDVTLDELRTAVADLAAVTVTGGAALEQAR